MKRKNSKKGLTSTIALLSSVSLVSVGFAAWVLTSGDEKSFEAGNLKVDTVNDNSHTFEDVLRIKGRSFSYIDDKGNADPDDDETVFYDVLRNTDTSVNPEAVNPVTLASVYSAKYVEEDDLQEINEKAEGGWDVNYSANRRQAKDDDFVTTYTDDDHDIKAEKEKAYSFFTDSKQDTYSTGPEAAGWDLEVTTSDDDLEDIVFYFYVEITNVREDETPASILGDIDGATVDTADDETVLEITDNDDHGYASALTQNLISNATVEYADFDDGDDDTVNPENSGTKWYSDAQYVPMTEAAWNTAHPTPAEGETYAKYCADLAEEKAVAQNRAVIVKVSFPWGSAFGSKNPLDHLVSSLQEKVPEATSLTYDSTKLQEAAVHLDSTLVWTTLEAYVGYRAQDTVGGETEEQYNAYKLGALQDKILDVNKKLDKENRSLAISTTQNFDKLEDALADVTFQITFTAKSAQ